MQADFLRKKFLEFFKSKKHKIIESDSLAPKDDPTVLFTPAGMNQFKKEFMGFDSGFTRVATAQRCLRTDDLDKVGKTTGHHTFFEMLGNFSFGDYFKKEAISYAWEFMTEVLKIDKEKLWVSIYKDDDEALKVWRDLIKVPQDKIIKLGDKENFWPSEAKEKGPNGPCGPCSEIFFDLGVNTGCRKSGCTPACNCGRFVEAWNLVFTQYNRLEGGVLEPLPKKNIDTGMGLERLAAVMQGAPNNFETDLFKPIIKEIETSVQKSVRKEFIYAIADHIRAVVFAIYDGVLPSNEKRGYVVRKLIRRSRMHLWALGIKKPFLYKLVPLVADIMRAPYPELQKRQENIAEIILTEEKKFIATLDSSEDLLKKGLSELVKLSKTLSESDSEKAGVIAFQLYDTYGIPLELTENWLETHGIKISKVAFEKELTQQKSRSKLQSAMKGDVFSIKGLDLGVKETKFLGYKDYIAKAKILKIVKDGKETKKASKGDVIDIILDRTPFYPEAGGQVGDTGEIIKGKNTFEVLDTKRAGKVIVHIGKVKQGSFKKSDLVSAQVNIERRLAIARNHTGTHLLQAALRKVLGAHVQQQGSLVAEDRLRFDFTHFKDIDKEQLDRIEEIVNGYVLGNYPLEVKQMALSEARKTGALAFFAEKYESKVRVVLAGDFSKELCGGTHLENTAQVGLFKIIREGSIAQGVRRIEAVTGKEAYRRVKAEEELIEDVSVVLGVSPNRLIPELERRLSELRQLEKQLSANKVDTLKTSLDNVIGSAESINGINFIVAVNTDVDSVRKAVDLIKEKVKSNAIIYSTTGSNLSTKIFLAIGVTSDLVESGVDASELIKEIAPEFGGSGGGRKDFAQAGGNSPEKNESALQKLKALIAGLKL